MTWLSDLLSGGGNQAQQQISNYYNKGMAGLQPYIQGGATAGTNLATEASALTDPTKLQADWINSYQESPQAKQDQAMATQEGLGAASSMGLMGSSTAQNALQQGTTNIGLADRQNYLNDLMQKYTAGVGINQNMYNTGEYAAGQGANLANSMGTNAANISYAQGAAPGQMIGGLIGTAAGAFLGGPGGAMLGSKLFGGGSGSGGGYSFPQLQPNYNVLNV